MSAYALTSRKQRARSVGLALVLCLAIVCVAELAIGAMAIPPARVLGALFSLVGLDIGVTLEAADVPVITAIRLPRLLFGIAVGAGLATAGASLQGVFRNPLADPGLIGVSAGAAAGAATTIVVFAETLETSGLPTPLVVAVAATAGGGLTTWLVYQLSSRHGHTSIATMLLAGVALNALAGAWIGWLTYLADDAQLRSLTMWTLGSLGGATPKYVPWIVPPTLVAALWLSRHGRALDALSLGDAEARHLGQDPERIKRRVIVGSALAAGLTVGVTGLIGFVGLVVPHVIRLVIGPAHGRVLGLSLVAGPLLVVSGDLLSRTIVAPTEVPIGVVMSSVGAPVFLALLLKSRDATLR